jgi:hypothetical protein
VGGGNDREEIELVSVGKKEEMTEWWKRGFQYGKRCNHTCGRAAAMMGREATCGGRRGAGE